MNALLHLVESPEWVRILREEAERTVVAEGWSRTTLAKMVHLDSFLRESQRVNSVNIGTPPPLHPFLSLLPLSLTQRLVSLMRQAMKDVTLVDGTVIPKGTFIVAPQYATHHDERLHPEPDRFDPSRWAPLDGADDGDSRQVRYVTTTSDFIPFGHGKQAWCVPLFLDSR